MTCRKCELPCEDGKEYCDFCGEARSSDLALLSPSIVEALFLFHTDVAHQQHQHDPLHDLFQTPHQHHPQQSYPALDLNAAALVVRHPPCHHPEQQPQQQQQHYHQLDHQQLMCHPPMQFHALDLNAAAQVVRHPPGHHPEQQPRGQQHQQHQQPFDKVFWSVPPQPSSSTTMASVIPPPPPLQQLSSSTTLVGVQQSPSAAAPKKRLAAKESSTAKKTRGPAEAGDDNDDDRTNAHEPSREWIWDDHELVLCQLDNVTLVARIRRQLHLYSSAAQLSYGCADYALSFEWRQSASRNAANVSDVLVAEAEALSFGFAVGQSEGGGGVRVYVRAWSGIIPLGIAFFDSITAGTPQCFFVDLQSGRTDCHVKACDTGNGRTAMHDIFLAQLPLYVDNKGTSVEAKVPPSTTFLKLGHIARKHSPRVGHEGDRVPKLVQLKR
jgi:hypothetical protein